MKLFRLRQKAHKRGLIIEEIQNEGFLICNNGVKNPVEIKCSNLEEVEKILVRRK